MVRAEVKIIGKSVKGAKRHLGLDFFDALATHEVVELFHLVFAETCFGECLGKCFGADFQATIKHRVNERRVRGANLFEVGGQKFAARDANREFAVLEAELAEHRCDGGEQVCFGVNAFGADDVHVQLEELAQAALLSLLVDALFYGIKPSIE